MWGPTEELGDLSAAFPDGIPGDPCEVRKPRYQRTEAGFVLELAPPPPKKVEAHETRPQFADLLRWSWPSGPDAR